MVDAVPTPEQIAAYKRADDLLQSMLRDPVEGPKVRAAAKVKFPDVTFAEDRLDPIVERFQGQLEDERKITKALQDRLDAKDAAEAEAAASRKFETDLAGVKTKLNLTDEGVAKVLERMKATKNYTDIEGAAHAVIADSPKPAANQAVPNWLPQKLNLFGSADYDESLAKLHRDPQGYMDEQLREFVKDPDKYVRETFGTAA